MSASPSPHKAINETVVHSQNAAGDIEINEHVFLLTVRLVIVDAFGQEHPVRALLDSASQPNLMTKRLACLLQLPRERANVKINGAGSCTSHAREAVVAEVVSKKQAFSCTMKFLLMDKLTANLPAQTYIADWKIPEGIVLADPQFNKAQPVDLIIGAKHY